MDTTNRDKVANFLRKYFSELIINNLNRQKNCCEDNKVYNSIDEANS